MLTHKNIISLVQSVTDSFVRELEKSKKNETIQRIRSFFLETCYD